MNHKAWSSSNNLHFVNHTFGMRWHQVMKVLLYTWLVFLPFVLELSSGIALEGICFITAIGFFGLDEVRSHTINSCRHYFVNIHRTLSCIVVSHTADQLSCDTCCVLC